MCRQTVCSLQISPALCCALQDAVPAVSSASKHSAGDQCTRPAPGKSHPIQSAPSQDAVFPQQLSDWPQHAPDTPVHVLSLLRFIPSCSNSSDNAGKSQGATVPDLAAKRGCGARRVLAAGVIKKGGEFDRGCWDAVSIVEYPSRAALRDALMSDAHQRQFTDAAVFAVLPIDNAAAKL